MILIIKHNNNLKTTRVRENPRVTSVTDQNKTTKSVNNRLNSIL